MRILLAAALCAAAGLPASAALPPDNPFSAPSSLPYSLPPFDRIKAEHFIPAFEAGMAGQRAEVEAIVSSTEAPTFDNTIVPLERSGRLLSRASRAFYNLNSADTSDAMQKIDTEMAPRLTAHGDAISMDPRLFGRIRDIHGRLGSLGLDAESAQLVRRYYRQFSRSGALLGEKQKKELKQVNKELAELTTKFDQNLMKGARAGAVAVDSAAALDGFTPEQLGAAAAAAGERGLSGKWLITLQNTTVQPALDQLKDRALRERIFRASAGRNRGGESDNTALAVRIAELRSRQAALLGFDTYAAYLLDDQSARTPAAVNSMLARLAPAALAKARGEADDIRKAIREEAAAGTEQFEPQPWDWGYYAQKARKARFDYGEEQVKPYFELERVLRDGVFYAATRLYGITFRERKDLPVYHPDVRVFEVFEQDGEPLGLLLRDDYKRDSKDGGAWMEYYVDQSGLLGQKPVVVVCQNVPKPAEGQPALLTFDEVETMFHEFGHALHGLFSDVKYPLLAGLNVPADFAEYPSQINEMFLRDPDTLAHFARHYRTGEPMPAELREKVLSSLTYGQGYGTLEYVKAAMIDQAWYQLAPGAGPRPEGIAEFEQAALKAAGAEYPLVPPRYHTPYFAHAFSGGYQASYYAYIWSEVLARDTGEWFRRHGGFQRANGDFFRAKVLSRGRTMEPGDMFEQFYGGSPEIGPLLEYRGLVPAGGK